MKLEELQRLAQTAAGVREAELLENMHSQLRQMGLDPSAIYQELEMSSPLVDTHADSSRSNAQVQLHSHAFFELIFCCNDCGAEYLVGPERYRLQKGDIIFVPPGISHRPLLPETMEVPYERYVLWLSREFMSRFAKLFPYAFTEKQAHASMLRTGGTAWENLGDLFAAGVEESRQRADGWQAAVVGNTILLLTRIKRATDRCAARPLRAEKPELLDRIAAYVEENYHRPITIDELSRRFYVSSSMVSHLFRQKMGVSFYRYVTQRRLIASKSLIEQGVGLETVAAQTGFGDYSGFYRAFKQAFGISPRQYRALQEEAKAVLPG